MIKSESSSIIFDFKLVSLQKEFQGSLYDGLINHTTIVFPCYIVLAWQNRCNTEEQILGRLFYELCTEVNELDWAVALQYGLPVLPIISRLTSIFRSAKVE